MTVRHWVRLLTWGALLAVAAMLPVAANAADDSQVAPGEAAIWGTLPPKIDRVFAAGPPASVLVAVIAPEKLIGWPLELSAKAKALLPPDLAALQTVGHLAGRGSTSSPEAVAALRPDLILDAGEVSATYLTMAERVQRQTGITYALINGRFVNTPTILRQAGKLLGHPDRGEELALFAEGLMAEISRKIATVPQSDRPRVYFARGPHGLETGLRGSINSELIEYLGAVNIAGEKEGTGIATVSMEQVMRWDPDVILVEAPTFVAQEESASFFKDGLQKDSWQQLRAVRNHRVFLAPALPFGWIDAPPSVNRIVGLPWLAGKLYPDLFKDVMRQQILTFYQKFYRVTLSDEQLDHLVKGDASI
ncbi:iron ABC transporter substrate-binding protein [Telmatospirillum sp.]|uniref:iron ABC transporter substrate-binding protein n=1 Tax=Telmatospirillum sp. TaxID=2079197 RepID=UPI00283FED0D|nr:iron ABC transporter substrate-binding protein [Telmatospirillum sp.]MDR3435846.1 iron ABC transporter substrate-binding protein [Telmatospirillum sp.]